MTGAYGRHYGRWQTNNPAALERVHRRAASRVRGLNVTQYVREYRESHPCVDCGESDPIVLEFDHVPELGQKTCEVSACGSVEAAEREIEKCEVVCANCHKRRTYKRQEH